MLEIARGEVGKADPAYATTAWCARFVSWVAQQAQTQGFIPEETPAQLHTDARAAGRLSDVPMIGAMAFIDLLGQNNANDYITHVGIVESVDGDAVTIIQGNGNPDPTVVTRTTYHLHDSMLIDFATFA